MASPHVAALGSLAALAFAMLGCSTTAGSTWVSQPEPGPFVNDDLSLAASGESSVMPDDHAVTADDPRSHEESLEVAADEASRPRTRLRRTVTLGETYVAYYERGADAPAPAPSPPVTITINNYANQPGYYDGYYGAPYFVGDYRPGRPRPTPHAAQPTRPGENWPAIPSHGPAFPFKTAPASPWAPAR